MATAEWQVVRKHHTAIQDMPGRLTPPNTDENMHPMHGRRTHDVAIWITKPARFQPQAHVAGIEMSRMTRIEDGAKRCRREVWRSEK
eukprot:365241-Chlamydomonas_euryale.AAC.17